MLWLKVCDVRGDLSRQHRSIGRLRAKLESVPDRKAPLIAALQSELSTQQAAIAQLRSQLAAQQAAFASDEEAAHAVYEAALRAIEANSRTALSAAEAEVTSLAQASNELASFALVESTLQTKCAQLAAKNADNESKHQQRMAAMRAEWEDSRAALADAASRARHDSERRYKAQVMAAINISYERMSEEIAAMQHNKADETSQLRALNDRMQQCRRTIADERSRDSDEQRQRADSQRALFDVRLALRQVRRDMEHEQHKLAQHRTHEEQRQRQARLDRDSRQSSLASELSGWKAVRASYDRSVRRVRSVVVEAERARSHSSFQQLVEECIKDVKGGSGNSNSSTKSLVSVAEMSSEDRQRILRLLFARIAEAETLKQQRQQPQQQSSEEQEAQQAVQTSLLTEDVAVAVDAVAPNGPSFFLTQNQPDEAEEQLNNDTSHVLV